ncbi:MAG: alpha-galactosidase, partial [Spirochaetaceae bacterium]|nr:alpha-galactosidase [Spirochaetaceae bacterium]
MHTDPRFAAVVDEIDGQIRLRISAARALELGEAESLVLETGLEELLGLARVPEATRAAFRDPGRRLVLVNGWQSWSFAGELGRSERVRPTLLKGMAPFSQPPCRPAARGEFLSHFYLGLRAGEERLLLVSRNSGTPPVTFRLGRRRPTLRVGILAAGARFEAGAPVAELRLFHRTGYFGAKDAFRAAFGGFGHFDRLAFLGQGGSLMPGGYESWYNHYTKIDEAMIEEDLEALVAEPNLIRDYYLARGRPTVFQIDDGWQRTVGEWEIHEGKFPRGLKRLAARAEEKGLVPGLWLAPFLVTRSSAVFRDHPDWLLRGKGGRLVSAGWNPNWEGDFFCLDLSIPEVGDYLEALFERVVEDWGFRYLKLDFLYAGFLPGKRAR